MVPPNLTRRVHRQRGCPDVRYTASIDRTAIVWDRRPRHTLKDHVHWVTTLVLNTGFVLCTRPYDHTGKKLTSDEDGQFLHIKQTSSLTPPFPKTPTDAVHHPPHLPHRTGSSPAQATTPSSSGPLSSIKPIARLTGQRQTLTSLFPVTVGQLVGITAVRVWEGRMGKFVAMLRGYVGAVYRLAWRLLVSARKDNTPNVWCTFLMLSWN